MTSILTIGSIWSIYGLLGLFGIQIIPDKFIGTVFEEEYKRVSGVRYLIQGVPLLLCGLLAGDRIRSFSFLEDILFLIAITAPGFLYTSRMEKKFNRRLESAQDEPEQEVQP